ncbi:hypothetical protein Vafri_2824, partial [Volvox africanus]
PGCGFDYAVPDVAAAVAERRFKEAFGRAPTRVRQVFVIRPGPQGTAFSVKWIDALLAKPHRSRQSNTSERSAGHQTTPKVNAPTSHEPRCLGIASAATGKDVANLLSADSCNAYARSGATTAFAAADSFLNLMEDSDLPPLVPGCGPWLSYCPDLRAWTVPFPLGGAAARFLFARRQEEEVQRQQLRMVGAANLAGGGVDAGTGAVSGLEEAAEATSRAGRGPELDSRIVFPLPVPVPRLIGFTLLAPPLLLLALPLLLLALPFMLVWMVL